MNVTLFELAADYREVTAVILTIIAFTIIEPILVVLFKISNYVHEIIIRNQLAYSISKVIGTILLYNWFLTLIAIAECGKISRFRHWLW